jgi:hypothetical protein
MPSPSFGLDFRARQPKIICGRNEAASVATTLDQRRLSLYVFGGVLDSRLSNGAICFPTWIFKGSAGPRGQGAESAPTSSYTAPSDDNVYFGFVIKLYGARVASLHVMCLLWSVTP